jgi:hypothetical protein
MIPPAQVQRTVDREQPHFFRRRPVDVARLATRAALGLSHSALDRDDDVAKVGSSAWREREPVGGASRGRSSRPALVRREGSGREEGKGEHIGRFESAAHALVQSGQLTIVRQDQPD